MNRVSHNVPLKSPLSIIKPNTKNIGQFVLGDVLGEGTFGIVRIGTHMLTGEKVAIKILEKIKILEQTGKTRIDREIKILKSLHHNNIIHLYSVIQSSTSIYLIMEYANGKELFDYINLKKRLSEIESCKFFQQIISGIEYLSKCRIAHRDIKPENLLIDEKNTIKIVDFGLSNFYPSNNLLSTACGSPCYAAPEMIKGEKYNGLQVDIWSSGIVLYAMLVGYLPFEENNNDLLYKKICSGHFKIPFFLSDSAKDILHRVLTVDPTRRITIEKIKEHPWFNLINPKLNYTEGLLVNEIVIPIDEELVEIMTKFEYDKVETRKNILMNKQNHITTTYYLLLKQKIRNSIMSIGDLKSYLFNNYIKDPSNRLEKYKYDIDKVIEERANNTQGDNIKSEISPSKKTSNINTESYQTCSSTLIAKKPIIMNNEKKESKTPQKGSNTPTLEKKNMFNSPMYKKIKVKLEKRNITMHNNIIKKRERFRTTTSTNQDNTTKLYTKQFSTSSSINNDTSLQNKSQLTEVKLSKKIIKPNLLTNHNKQILKTEEKIPTKNFNKFRQSLDNQKLFLKKMMNLKTKEESKSKKEISNTSNQSDIIKTAPNLKGKAVHQYSHTMKNLNVKAISPYKKIKYDAKAIEANFHKISVNNKEMIHNLLNKIRNKDKGNIRMKKFLSTSVSFENTHNGSKENSFSLSSIYTKTEIKKKLEENEKNYLQKKAQNKKFDTIKEEEDTIINSKKHSVVLSRKSYVPSSSKVNSIFKTESATSSLKNISLSEKVFQPLDLSNVIFNSLKELKDKLEKSLNYMKIKYRGTKNKYYCDKNEIKFDIDINKIEIIDGGYVVAFKRTKGSMVLFRHIAQIVLMKLLG